MSDKKLKAEHRVNVDVKMIEMLLAKKPLPADAPDDSVDAASVTQKYLKDLENDPDRETKTAGN